MYSAAYIDQLVEEAAVSAREEEAEPISILDMDLDRQDFTIPNLGNYVPDGWVAAGDSLFVDSSGWGTAGELAFTQAQFIERLRQYKLSGENWGFGIVEAGEFQVFVGVFKPDPRDFTHSGKLTGTELEALGTK